MTPEEKLAHLGIQLPVPPQPVASYVPHVLTGSLLFVSGQMPMQDGRLKCTGLLGKELVTEQGAECARQCALNAIAVMKSALGELSRVSRVVKVSGYVASVTDFLEHPKVVNGASELLNSVFGEKGKHARVAVGCPVLPLNAPVVVDVIVEVV